MHYPYISKIILFLSLSLIPYSHSEWTKVSLRANNAGVESAFLKAFETYSQNRNDVDINFLEKLSVYWQVNDGLDYKLYFIDLKSKKHIVREYLINSPPMRNSKKEYIYDYKENFDKVVSSVLASNDARFSIINDLLDRETSETGQREISKIEVIDAVFNYYFIVTYKIENKEVVRVVGQDKEKNEYEVFGEFAN